MAVYVNTNVSSLNGRRYLNNVQNQLTTTYQRLSSGMRINSAKDDAAGLQIADRLTTQINGLNQGNRNSNDAIALAQTMEGALDETSNMLQKIRTLAVQASNGTNTQEDRNALQQEVASLSYEISRIADQTKFGGQNVLLSQGEGMIADDGTITFQVGANNGDEIKLSGLSAGFHMSGLKVFASAASGVQLDVADAGNDATKGLIKDANDKVIWTVSSANAAKATLDNIDKMIAAVDSKRADLGAFQNYTHANHSNIKQYDLVYLF